jgi:glutathione S-transferase
MPVTYRQGACRDTQTPVGSLRAGKITMVGPSSSMTRIVGSYLSPYVRKVLAVLDIKGIDYEVDPIVPFFGGEDFAKISPLRRVPVLVDDRVIVSDSTVICEYLEDRYPSPSVYPGDIAAKARARWLEEFADTRLGDLFVWRLFNQVAIKRAVWGEKADDELVARTLSQDVPQALDFLEAELAGTEDFFVGPASIADVAIASFFRNAELSRYRIDAARWPGIATWVATMFASGPLQKLRKFEDISMRTAVGEHRRALKMAGAPITERTVGTSVPRRGLMPI